MTTRGPMMHLHRPPKFRPGDAWHAWLVAELLVDGPRGADRQWLIVCGCGYQSRKWENEMGSRGGKCVSCANGDSRRQGNK